METASWVIRNKLTKEVVLETFSKRIADSINTDKYEAVPILAYLQEVNRNNRKSVAFLPSRDIKNLPPGV